MTDDELREIRARHIDCMHYIGSVRQPAPCEQVRLVDEIERLKDANASFQRTLRKMTELAFPAVTG